MIAQPPVWQTILAFIVALGPLVFIHEFGHYYVARLFGIPAETFSIGFGREIFGWNDKRGTRWRVSVLPLGGYVKFVGDMNPASQPSDIDHIPESERGRLFQLRPVWQRFLVVLAGPAANFIAAILIFAAFFTFAGFPSTPSKVTEIQQGSAAAAAGLQPGDRIVSIAGKATARFEDVQKIVMIRPGEAVDMVVDRNSKTLTLPVTLHAENVDDGVGGSNQIGRLGAIATGTQFERLSVVRAIPAAMDYCWFITSATAKGLWQMITGTRSPRELGGPVKIAKFAGQVAEMGWLQFVQMLAFFSINLGFINLLPVPMLDGGHLAFYTVEAIQRRPVSARAMDWAFRGGVAIILMLLLFTTANDFGLLDTLDNLIG